MKKHTTILTQIIRPIIVIMIILILVNAVVLSVYSGSYYVTEQRNDALRLAKNAASEMEKYEAFGFLAEYWERNYASMELYYSDEEYFDKKDRELRDRHPSINELYDVTNEQAYAFDEEDQKLFAELCYSSLSREFDLMKRAYLPMFLFSFNVRNGKLFYLVTGTTTKEMRISQGGDLFELGTTLDYTPGAYTVLDRVLETQEPVNNLELSRGAGADREAVHVFEPVYSDGKMAAIVGVSLMSKDMLYKSLHMMATILGITILFFVIMIYSVIRHVKKITVDPIKKEQMILEEYEKEKDSAKTAEELSTINTNNEIESLAESFSSMVTELDRYMDDIRKVTAEKERIGAELNVATRIQADMLPRIFPPFPDRNEFDLYASMTPAKEVGGDFYDFFFIDEDHLALVIADVSGKGVPAALFMVIAKTLIKNRTHIGSATPAQIFADVNEELCEGNDSMLFVTVWMGILTVSTGQMICANAGHEYPAIRRAGGSFELFKDKHGVPLATMEGMVFKDYELTLGKGDTIYLYTDGVTEATDTNNELFGTDRVIEVLNTVGEDAPIKAYDDAARAQIADFVKEAPQFDDITMLSFVYHGKN